MYTKNLLHQYHDLNVIGIYTNCHQSHFYYFFRLILQLDILQIDQFIGNGIDSQTCQRVPLWRLLCGTATSIAMHARLLRSSAHCRRLTVTLSLNSLTQYRSYIIRLLCRYACPRNAHLHLVNSAFSGYASLKLALIIKLLADTYPKTIV